MKQHANHGRDHAPGGMDPIPGLSSVPPYWVAPRNGGPSATLASSATPTRLDYMTAGNYAGSDYLYGYEGTDPGDFFHMAVWRPGFYEVRSEVEFSDPSAYNRSLWVYPSQTYMPVIAGSFDGFGVIRAEMVDGPAGTVVMCWSGFFNFGSTETYPYYFGLFASQESGSTVDYSANLYVVRLADSTY